MVSRQKARPLVGEGTVQGFRRCHASNRMLDPGWLAQMTFPLGPYTKTIPHSTSLLGCLHGHTLLPVRSMAEGGKVSATYSGQCFCGAVALAVTGEPVAMGYCHCSSCRSWSAGPVNAFSLWPPEAVKITKGADQIGSYQKTPLSLRKWCKKCGGHLLTEHQPWKLVDVYAAVIPDLPFKAAVHVNYRDTVLPMRDGLPKQKDFPKEMGGSGVLVSED